MTLFQSASEIETRSIQLSTRKNTTIPNEQYLGISSFNENQFPLLLAKLKGRKPRTKPSGIYNCHGLVFASRRTAITERAMLEQILKEDGYKKIDGNEVGPGDVIIYFKDGMPTHSGIILSGTPSVLAGGNPAMVLGKLGWYGEAVHPFNLQLFEFDLIEYYKVDDDDYGRTEL